MKLIFIKWYCKSNENSRGINAEKLINSAETEDLKLMARNLWWELVINISKVLTLSAFPTRSLTLPSVITVGMLTRDKTNSLSKEVSVPESIRVAYSRCQINRTLYFSMKLDHLTRFPNLLGNFNWFIFVCKEEDSCDIDMYLYLLIFIPPWYFEPRKSVYPNTGICSSKRSKNLQQKKLPLVYL